MNYVLHSKIEMMDFCKYTNIKNLTSKIKINTWKSHEYCM